MYRLSIRPLLVRIRLSFMRSPCGVADKLSRYALKRTRRSGKRKVDSTRTTEGLATCTCWLPLIMTTAPGCRKAQTDAVVEQMQNATSSSFHSLGFRRFVKQLSWPAMRSLPFTVARITCVSKMFFIEWFYRF
jgi:hypothetical protein